MPVMICAELAFKAINRIFKLWHLSDGSVTNERVNAWGGG